MFAVVGDHFVNFWNVHNQKKLSLGKDLKQPYTPPLILILRLNDAAALVKHQRYVSFLVMVAFFGLIITLFLLVLQLWLHA